MAIVRVAFVLRAFSASPSGSTFRVLSWVSCVSWTYISVTSWVSALKAEKQQSDARTGWKITTRSYNEAGEACRP